MTTRKRAIIIASITLSTPFICMMIAHPNNGSGSDASGLGTLSQVFALGLGVVASVVALILGPLVSYLTRGTNNNFLSLSGYLLPCLAVIAYLLFSS